MWRALENISLWYYIRKDTTSSMTTSQMNKSKNTIRKQINNETPTQKESSIPVISTYTATSEETTLLSTYQVTTNDHTSMEAETNTLATTNEVGLSTEKEKTNSNRTIDKTSHLAIIMPVLLILTGTIIIVISVIVFKKRRHERGKNVYHGDHEPPEQVTYENCESPKASVKRNNSYIVNDAARQPDPSYINTEREAQPDDVSYEMLQLNGKSITEYTTIDLHSTCTDGNTAQVGNYEVLNKESQHQFLYSEINSKC